MGEEHGRYGGAGERRPPAHAPTHPPTQAHLVYVAVRVCVTSLVVAHKLAPPVGEVLLADPLAFGEGYIGPNPPLEGSEIVVPCLAVYCSATGSGVNCVAVRDENIVLTLGEVTTRARWRD